MGSIRRKLQFYKFVCLTLVLFVGPFLGTLCAQERLPIKAACLLDIPNGVSAPEGKPVLFGSEFKVPHLRFRFRNVESIENSLKVIRIFYIWEWWRFPSRRSNRGNWDEAGDIVECTNVNAMEITIPSYSVAPKGWYWGEYANSRKNTPRFHHLEVAFETKECGAPRILFSKNEVARFYGSVAVVSLPCGGLVEYEFVKDELIGRLTALDR